MGASLTMIDRHYGHLARDGREHAIRLLLTTSCKSVPYHFLQIGEVKAPRMCRVVSCVSFLMCPLCVRVSLL
jgi:hypothetical protein